MSPKASLLRYAAGQPLFVRVEGIHGAADWCDANVVEPVGGGWHKLLLFEDENSEGQLVELDLDPFNHGPREIPLRSFRELWVRPNCPNCPNCPRAGGGRPILL